MTKVEIKEYNIGFGARVRSRRHELKLRAEQVAELAGITPQFLSEVERGKKSTRALYVAALAFALDTTSDALLYPEGHSPSRHFSRSNQEDADAIADMVLSFPPAIRRMAAEQLLAMLKMLEASIPR